MRAAAVQLSSTPDRDRNLEAADRLTRDGGRAGRRARRAAGEVARAGHARADRRGRRAARRPRARPGRAATARELGIDLVAGSIAERVEGAERGANTSVHVGPDGEDRAVYRKIHMFDVEVGGRTYRESEHEAPGDEPVTLRARRRRRPRPDHLLRPALPRALPHPRGPRREGLTVPAAFTETTTRDHWEVLLRARAIEDQCFVVAANQVGEPAPGHAHRRALDDRRPVGHRARPGAGLRDVHPRRPRLRPARRGSARSSRRSPTGRPAAYRWPEEARA